jgi:hypothetical protein
MSILTPHLLDQLGSEVEFRYPAINSGGCCIFASLVARHIAKRLPTTIKVENYCEADIDSIRPRLYHNSIDSWNSHGLQFAHVAVSFVYQGRKYYYDTRGCNTKYEALVYNGVLAGGNLTIDEAAELASQRGWNPAFDRRIIPELTELIDRFFATIH